MKDETLRLDNLSIGYAGRKAPHKVAERICASLNSGDLTCLLGANGVGKSTLLRTLSSIQPFLEGNIYISGKDIRRFTREQLATMISVVLTDRIEVGGMTVYELVSLGRTPYTNYWGTLDERDRKIVDDALAMVDITSLGRRGVQSLSDGERQKTMIAKALAQETPIIFLDEPTAFLDFPSKVDVMQLLRRLSREMNKSILLSTHDVELALQIADKIWLMDRSKGLVTGTPEDLVLQGQLSHFFPDKGVSFDVHTGLFCVKNVVSHHISVVGTNDERRSMLQKALLRNGIGISEVASVVVEITEKGFRLLDNGTMALEVDTIDALLQNLQL